VPDARDRREIAAELEAALRVHEVHDRLAADRPDEQRVAVGRALRRRVRADHRAGAGLVLDDDRLPEPRRELLPERARDDVDPAARRERHDEAQRLRRVGLRRGWQRGGKQRRDGEEADDHERGPSICLAGVCAARGCRAARCG
jgi:hypothetical protein